MSGCGSCTLCCTLMKVNMAPVAEAVKPAGEACQFCARGAGCTIYTAKPTACTAFSCLWLLSQDRVAERLPSALRPDRSGVVLEVNSKQYLVAHCQTPDAWRREPMHRFLRSVAARTRVLIKHGQAGDKGVSLLEAHGEPRPMQRVGVSPTTNEVLYKLEL